MSKNINDLREAMFDTLASLKKGEITVEQAKAMAEIGQTIVNSAKVEIEFVKTTGGTGSGFVPDVTPALPDGVVGIVRHRLAG